MRSNHLTILLAEDGEDDAFLMRRAFEKAHLANPLNVVRDGREAIAYLSGQGIYADRSRYPFPCLLLLDLKMPKVSGFEVLTWIRNQPELKRLPVVVLTSSTEVPDISKAYDLGANSYLVKPGTFEDLMHMVEKLGGYWLITNEKPSVS